MLHYQIHTVCPCPCCMFLSMLHSMSMLHANVNVHWHIYRNAGMRDCVCVCVVVVSFWCVAGADANRSTLFPPKFSVDWLCRSLLKMGLSIDVFTLFTRSLLGLAVPVLGAWLGISRCTLTHTATSNYKIHGREATYIQMHLNHINLIYTWGSDGLTAPEPFCQEQL